LSQAKEKNIPVVVDAAAVHMAHYKECQIVTVAAAQACQYAQDTNPIMAAHKIYKELHPTYMLLTLGANGLVIVDETTRFRAFTALPAIPRDSCGCGDAVAAAAAYCVASEKDIEATAKYCNAAGAAAVELFGASPVGAHDVQRKLGNYAGAAAKVCTSIAEACRLRSACKAAGIRFGVANGIFDLLHAGHMDMLQKARAECDYLCVLVNSDASAEMIKRKPINPENLRVQMLANLAMVDAVLVFDDAEPYFPLTRLCPDVIIKGPDNTVEMTFGADECVRAGARFVSTERVYDTSTTKTLAEITERAKNDAASAAANSSST
jgi:D-beta-D-heptose 7-phosphate kinase/D-beta-D-heptose 1-phosphate adenosyltransferase